MTTDQILRKLRRSRHKFNWRINSRGHIRANCRGTSICPLTSINFDPTDYGQIPLPSRYVHYLEPELGMSRDEVIEFTVATDYKDPNNRLRHRILKACGLV